MCLQTQSGESGRDCKGAVAQKDKRGHVIYTMSVYRECLCSGLD